MESNTNVHKHGDASTLRFVERISFKDSRSEIYDFRLPNTNVLESLAMKSFSLDMLF